MNNCLCCGSQTKNSKFCSRSCAAKVNNNVKPKRVKQVKPLRDCLYCKTPTLNTVYCSIRCQRDYELNAMISRWTDGDVSVASSPTSGALSRTIKKWLIAQAGHKCPECGWNKVHPLTGKCPLEIDHINGDSSDNRVENLRVVCPNCHSLSMTFRALNSGRGRKKYQTSAG